MCESRGIDTPLVRHSTNEEAPFMSKEESTRFRRAAARISYMAQDRGDLSFPASHLASKMANPRVGDEVAVKRVLRYLVANPICALWFPFQDEPDELCVFADSDWGNDEVTRRSMSGGVVCHGAHSVCWWSRKQAKIALSSCEAEVNALVKAACEGIFLHQILRFFECPASLNLCTDSSAARGVTLRTGAGKLKHLSLKQLWLQELVGDGRIRVSKVPRELNPSDAFTHAWSIKEKGFFTFLGFTFREKFQ